MLKQISVHNFKALKNLDNVSLNKITLIGGKNNSGKSTLLEALFAYMDVKNPNMCFQIKNFREPKDILFVQPDPNFIWAPVFHKFNLEKKINLKIIDTQNNITNVEIIYNDKFIPKHPIPVMNGNIPTPTIATTDGFKALTVSCKRNQKLDFFAHTIIHAGGFIFISECDKQQPLPSAQMVTSTTLHINNIPTLLGKLDKNDEQNKILEPLRLFEPNLQRFQLIKENQQDVIYVDLGNKQKMPVNLLGSGFCRFLSIALLITTGNVNVILIDEIENGIHHSLLCKFWTFLIEVSQSNNCQIIATTHSYEMIKAFSETAQQNSFDDIGYIRLALNDNGVTAYQFNNTDISSSLSSEFEVR
ncbi:MAG: AAA family ATPase [Planctomycetaceae bacterium]|jgi:AAA15 family ATPase/GTPase|nr:AAA family ATPase [Planctomycetaceae bacterium]